MLHTQTRELLPPGPTGSVEEQLEQFLADPFGHVERMAAEHGPIFALRLGALGNEDLIDPVNNGAWVFLTRADQIKTMYTADEAVSSGAVANGIFFGTREKSVAYLDGRAHRQRRSQIQPAFSGARDYAKLITAVVDRRIAAWPRGTEFALFPELQKLTTEIIVEVVCGLFDPDDRARLCELLPRTENARYSRDEVLAADAEIRAFIQQRIPGHLARAEERGQDDVFAGLLRFAAQGDASLTDEVVRDEVFSLLYTGFSTTANTLSWAFLRILDNPQVHRDLLAELGDRFHHRPLDRGAFAGLRLVEATITETLRLHPVSALNGVRMLKAPLEIDGYLMPAGTILVHCAHLIQRSPELYPEPEDFRPQRFVDQPTEPYNWAAFGGGQRTCVGRGYSREEMKMVLALVLSALPLRAAAELPVARQEGIFMAPENGALVLIEE